MLFGAMGKSFSALDVSYLRFRYPGVPADQPWTVNVGSLTLEAGEQLLITGPSGSGKSTLLHLVAGLWDPVKGRVLVKGQNVHGFRGGARDHFRGRHMGMIFQTFNLLHGFTALENVLLGMLFAPMIKEERRIKAVAALTQLGLDDVHARVDRLSVGQQQRVAVARAVAGEPALVLADEPTASLDPPRAAEAIELIQASCRTHNAALLCTSHDPSIAGRFERRVSLEELRGGDFEERTRKETAR